MKKIVCLMLLVAFTGFTQAQNFHDWHANFRIIDDAGLPVNKAAVTVFYDAPPLSETSKDTGKITGLTDTNGVFTATHRDETYGLRFAVEKSGYYPIDINEDFHGVFSPEKLNRNMTLVLKKIVKPIAMYGKWVQRWPVKTDGTVGYDLMAGDWVAPNGKGVNTDILFTRKFDKKSITDYDYKLTVSFPKVGDGIQEFTVPDAEKGSGLRSPHEAPADGYQSQLVRENFHHPGQPGKSDYDDNRNYFFRVRTVLDTNGNVKSALYGKIYGDPEQMNFHYYLNPTPNSRNIECDPKQNLLGGLESFEQIKAP